MFHFHYNTIGDAEKALLLANSTELEWQLEGDRLLGLFVFGDGN